MRRCSAEYYTVKVGQGHRIFSSFTEYLPVCANLVYSIREGTYVFLCVSMIRALIKGLCENMRSYVKVDYYGTRFLKIKLLLLLYLKYLRNIEFQKEKKLRHVFLHFFPFLYCTWTPNTKLEFCLFIQVQGGSVT